MGHRKGIWIPVVTGLIQKDGMVLMGQRPRGNSLAGLWEFPGGKIELGESPEEALERELREELGIFAEVGTLRLATTHSYGEKAVLIMFYDVHFFKGEPKQMHHADLKWVPIDRIGEMEIPQANYRILDRLTRALKTPAQPHI
jgi:8-oxo-dGTP diphosphatase